MTTPTKKCSNCEKDISMQKVVLHERYCKENMVKCPLCKEAVQKEELDEHNEENHAKAGCKECGKLIEKAQMSTHKLSCAKKLLQCAYCQLSLSKDELHDHEYICGSKTDECCLCHEMVPQMEYDLHIEFKCKGAGHPKEQTIDDLLFDSVIRSGVKVNEDKKSLKKENRRIISNNEYKTHGKKTNPKQAGAKGNKQRK